MSSFQILERELKDFTCRYHRNGIMGDGFHLCRFVWREGRVSRLMFASVFGTPGQLAVHSQDVNERWRGDDFEPALRAAIERYGDRAYGTTEPAAGLADPESVPA